MSSEEEESLGSVAQFARSPAEAIRGIVNYRQREGAKLYYRASERLDPEDLFSCDSVRLYDFLKLVHRRAREFGWAEGILKVPDEIDGPIEGNKKYLVTNHGQVSLEHLRAWEESYINDESRATQDTTMLYNCLMNSLSMEGRLKVQVYEEEYTVNEHMSGVLLLKVIIRESHIDSNATTSSLRLQIANLDDYMGEVNCDILKFNAHVYHLQEGLRARGEISTDILVNLFKAYKAVTDKKFVEYIEEKESRHDEGKDFTPTELMKLAGEKYKIMKDKHIWETPSKEQEDIAALETKVSSLEKKLSQSKKELQEQKKKKGGGVKSKRGGDSNRPMWLRKNTPPKKEDLRKSRQWNGVYWYWCHKDSGGKCSGKWRTHTQDKCTGEKAKQATGSKRKTRFEDDDPDPRKLKLSKAMETRMRISEKEDDSE